MRLPNLSPAVARRRSTAAGRLDGRILASQRPTGLACGDPCDPHKQQCAGNANCPNCKGTAIPNQYTCQA